MTGIRSYIHICLGFMALAAVQARADRNISAEAYRDRLEGMWTGQLIGNYAGRQVEGLTTVEWEGPDPVNKPVTEYNVQWNAILQGQYYNKNGELLGDTSRWNGDDDTCLEFLYCHSLQSQASLNTAERTDLWTNNVSCSGLYIANKQAWRQINVHGRDAGQSGSVHYNMHAGWAIDSQITTESLGAIAIGTRQRAADLAGDFGGITNSGYSLHAAQFYATMYAHAPFADNVETLVDKGLEAVPAGSWTRDIITEAKQLYQDDKDDDGQLNDWLKSRNEIIDYAHQRGRNRGWIESSSNTGLTTLAILYGQGNFKETVEYGVRGGQDSDCNPATGGGLVGMMKGKDAVIAELTAAGMDTSALPANYHHSDTITNLPKSQWTMSEVMDIFQNAAETQILSTGGSITGAGADRQYHLTDHGTGHDFLDPPDVSDPSGPRGLVGNVLEDSGEVNVVVTRNGMVVPDNDSYDRKDQSGLIDGVKDLRYNGVLPFDTYDGSTSGRTDGYELYFDREVCFGKVILHEGDIRFNGINSDPHDSEPKGGYFTDLAVEVFAGGQWTEVRNLSLSESLDTFVYFQSIELTFDPINGEAIRVTGPAGGVKPYTSLSELEVFCPTGPGDVNKDGTVDTEDLAVLLQNFDTAQEGWEYGDLVDNDFVDCEDLASLLQNWGASYQCAWGDCSVQAPEPSCGAIILIGITASLKRRSWKVRRTSPGAAKMLHERRG